MKFDKPSGDSVDGLDGAAYRELMRNQVTGVSIVASGSPGRRVGLTATSVSSLSAAPAKLLVCVGRANQAHNIVCEVGYFSVNFLGAKQRALAERFAGKCGVDGEARFGDMNWVTMATGAPVLGDSLASLDCVLIESHTFSTHSIFIGRVVAGRADGNEKPLVYFQGGYTELAGN
ncbi:MAG: flavin reductase family protein [Alphaproteobacteria bacterium]|nr:flavin reductase family protein [Alphaproteobacteria bacterium]